MQAVIAIKTLLPLLCCVAVAGCLAEPRTDAALRASPGFSASTASGASGTDAGGGGIIPCSTKDLEPFEASASRALSSCFLPPAKCKDNGANCVTKCLASSKMSDKCVLCISSKSQCVVEKCNKDCLPTGIIAADKALTIACPICTEKSCGAALEGCVNGL